MLDAVASRDCDRILDQCAPGFVFEFPMFGQQIDDPDLFRTDIGPGLALLEGLSFHDVVVDEMLDPSEVTLRYTGTATMATTGKPYRRRTSRKSGWKTDASCATANTSTVWSSWKR